MMSLHVFSSPTISHRYMYIHAYIYNPVLYIACTMSSEPPDRSEVWKLCYAVEFFSVIEALKLVTIEVESHLQTPDDPSLVCD